jgi:hypothetical protein
MRRSPIAVLMALLVLALTASVALAFKRAPEGEPSFNDGGLTLNAAGELAGLGGAT